VLRRKNILLKANGEMTANFNSLRKDIEKDVSILFNFSN